MAALANEQLPVVELGGITKRFGALTACRGVDLALYKGEIHGILGENGAGKSTLMKVLIGLLSPDAGSIRVNGRLARVRNPAEAAEWGMGMVHQHFSLVEPLTVWENTILGERTRFNPGSVKRRIKEISELYGLKVDPEERVADLSAGLRQRVEIIKCLRRDPQIVILDEPTSVLTPQESEFLFRVLRRVATEHGKAVALVSHKFEEVLAATDRVSIMREGEVVDRCLTAEVDAAALARSMLGRPVSLRGPGAALGYLGGDGRPDAAAAAAAGTGAGSAGAEVAAAAAGSTAAGTAPTAAAGMAAAGSTAAAAGMAGATAGEERDDPLLPQMLPVLKISEASARGRDGRVLLNELSLEVRPGEIVGVAGVEGNGQAALSDLLSDLLQLQSGSVSVGSKHVPAGKPGAMARAGVAVVPSDRRESGCILNMTVAENLTMLSPPRFSKRWGILDRKARDSQAEVLMAAFGVRASGPEAPMWSLSGGNQQRVMLAREISSNPKVLVASQPTSGLDVGGIEYVLERIRQAAKDGVGVLLISTELEEMLDIADRIVVIFRGSIVGGMSRSEAEVELERLGLLMSGVLTEPEAS